MDVLNNKRYGIHGRYFFLGHPCRGVEEGRNESPVTVVLKRLGKLNGLDLPFATQTGRKSVRNPLVNAGFDGIKHISMAMGDFPLPRLPQESHVVSTYTDMGRNPLGPTNSPYYQWFVIRTIIFPWNSGTSPVLAGRLFVCTEFFRLPNDLRRGAHLCLTPSCSEPFGALGRWSSKHGEFTINKGKFTSTSRHIPSAYLT